MKGEQKRKTDLRKKIEAQATNSIFHPLSILILPFRKPIITIHSIYIPDIQNETGLLM